MIMGSLDYRYRDKIVTVAELYRTHCGAIPVDTEVLTSIVEGYAGRPIRTTYKNVDRATLDAAEDCFVVNLSALRDSTKQRTDCTHELAHILHSYDWAPLGEIPTMRVNYFGSNAEWRKEEDACEEIALFLACPPWAVNAFIEQYFRYHQLRLFHLPEVRECLRLMTEHFQVPRNELTTQLSAQFPGVPLWQTLQTEKKRHWDTL